jgi:Mrp family chromosome partitioning ATPase
MSMVLGSRRSRRMMRRGRRGAALERAIERLAGAASDAGGWRTPPRPGGGTGCAGGRVAASAIDPALLADAAAQLVVEQAALMPGYLDPETGRPLLGDMLRPACRALTARASAPGASRRDRLILVTSPAAGDGKTFVAVNLALALSQGERRPVLLIDGDAQTAGAARALGWRPAPGLSEALAGDGAPGGLIGNSGLAHLSFVPPGSPSAAMAGLLAGARAALVMRELLAAEPDRLLIVDGPPLLTGLVGPALAAHAGQVVLVVAAGRTTQQAIDDSLTRLGERRNLHCLLARPAPPGERAEARRQGRSSGAAARPAPR